MTVMACPHGCGEYVQSTDQFCASCRRGLNETEIPLPGVCWQWWGSMEHRMRCRKKAGHAGPHSTHDDCGELSKEGDVCGLDDGHVGEHGWETNWKSRAERAEAALATGRHMHGVDVCVYCASGDLALRKVDALQAELSTLRAKLERMREAGAVLVKHLDEGFFAGLRDPANRVLVDRLRAALADVDPIPGVVERDAVVEAALVLERSWSLGNVLLSDPAQFAERDLRARVRALREKEER